MKRLLLTSLLIALCSVAANGQDTQPTPYPQTTAPSAKPIPTVSPTQQPTASPCNSTLVKVSKDEIVFAGFPTWIIVPLGVGAVIVLLFWYFFLKERLKKLAKRSLLVWVAPAICILMFLAAAFLASYWMGRNQASTELQNLIASRAGNVEVPINRTSVQPTPQPTLVATPQTSTQPQSASPQGLTWPISTIVLLSFTFLFLIALEMLFYIWLRWGSRGRETLLREIDYLRNQR